MHHAESLLSEAYRSSGEGLDGDRFTSRVIPLLVRAVPADAWCWSTADPHTLAITGSLIDGIPPSIGPEFFRIELTEPDVLKLSDLAVARVPVGALSEVTGQRLEESTRWRLIFGPLGLGDEARIAFVVDGACWGYLSLHRASGTRSFTGEELTLLGRTAPLLARGLRAAQAKATLARREGVLGLLVLDEELRRVASTPGTDEALYELEPWARERGDLPTAVYAAAARLRAGTSSAIRVPDRSGRRVTVRASWLEGPDSGRLTAVTLEETPPAELRQDIFHLAGLTSREVEVTSMVLEGARTTAIAEALYISPLTVQQHLKSVFSKLEVRSRRELVARILGGTR